MRVCLARSAEEIDPVRAKDILVRSFVQAYGKMPLQEINAGFQSVDDLRRFYEEYFESELLHYRKGGLIWVQAFEGEKLLGWAAFEVAETSAYMNLLVVDPEHWKKGVGRALTFSICSIYPKTRKIHLLLRKINEEGRKF